MSSIDTINTGSIYNGLISHGLPPADANTLTAVSYGESGYNPNAVGDGGDSIGLFQINIPAHWPKLVSWTGSTNRADWVTWLKNPDNNIYAASEVYKSQGLGAWSVYNNGSYKAYLGQNQTGTATSSGTLQPTLAGIALPAFSWTDGLPEKIILIVIGVLIIYLGARKLAS